MVPNWFRSRLQKIIPGSSLELSSDLGWIFFVAYLAWGFLHRWVLTDWVGFAVDEGFTTYGAQRIREGQVPHRDFFFLWSPGILYLHALAQSLGFDAGAERAISLVASAFSGLIVLNWAKEWLFSRWEQLVLAGALFLWGFSLWNIPYSSWIAVPLALLGIRSLEKKQWVLGGLFFALAFWFKQNIGLLSFAGSFLFLVDRTGRKAFLAAWFLGWVLPFVYFFTQGALPAAFYQIFLFPLTYRKLMAEPLPVSLMAMPMVAFGLWALSLYFFKTSPRIKALVQSGFLAYSAAAMAKEGIGFFGAWFYLFSLVAWLGSLLFLLERKKEDAAVLAIWPAALGVFLQVYPRWDFQHFLFVFPLAGIFFLWFIRKISQRYAWLPPLWLAMPTIFLLIGGGLFQTRLLFFSTSGLKDAVGFTSFGDGHLLNEEMGQVRDFLRSAGLKKGDPILVVPNATSFYRFSGFENPTPHDQFFPGYVHAFGAEEENVLRQYEKRGGQFVVFQERSKTELFAPPLYRELMARYEKVRAFPKHFSVYRLK